MLLTPQELNHAFSLISFTSEQRRAVESVSRRINQEPVLERLAQRDAACLADPRGPERLEADKDQLAALLGDLADVYPAVILLTRVSWLEGEYARLGISETLLRDALSDIPLWMCNFEKHTGRIGLREYTWLTNHLRMRLFRLGRLEYILTKSRVPAWFYFNGETAQYAALAASGLWFDASGQLCAQGCGRETVHTCEGGVITGYPIDALGRIQARPLSLRASRWELALGSRATPCWTCTSPRGRPWSPRPSPRRSRRRFPSTATFWAARRSAPLPAAPGLCPPRCPKFCPEATWPPSRSASASRPIRLGTTRCLNGFMAGALPPGRKCPWKRGSARRSGLVPIRRQHEADAGRNPAQRNGGRGP